MNFTDFSEAFKLSHINPLTYKINDINRFSNCCVYCSNNASKSLSIDGSFRQCLKCNKQFKANLLSQPIINYNLSTGHLKGTN